MTLAAIGIITVPERIAQAEALREQLGIGTVLYRDDQHLGCWWNARQAWTGLLTRTLPGEYALLLTDDAVLSEDAIAHVGRALNAIPPGTPVNFYSATKDGPEALEAGKSWYATAYSLNPIAFALPSDLIEPLLLWTGEHVSERYPHDDVVYARFLAAIGRLTYVSVPSLADHAPGPSVMGHGGRDRRARLWQPVTGHVDWNRGALDPHIVSRTPPAALFREDFTRDH